jgi:hypothetical protein
MIRRFILNHFRGSHRHIALITIVSMLAIGWTDGAAKTPSPAGGGLADLGLPELDITVTATGYEGIPDEIAAGRYLITLTAAEDASDFGLGGIGFVRPSGISGTEFLALMESTTGESATPVDEAAVDDAMFNSHYAGGANALLGESVQIVIDLPPGEWVAWGEDPVVHWEPVIFQVTGEMPAELPEPVADVTISEGEYVIAVAEGELATGSQVMRVDNIGAQSHFIEAGRVDVPIANADIEAELGMVELGTPSDTDFSIDENFADAFRTGIQSPGTSMWLATDVQPGTHLLWCFFPDVSDYMPHAMHGMYTIIEVED